MNPIAIIPHYNHSNKIGAVIQQLRTMHLPVLIVDDCSEITHQQIIRSLTEDPNVEILYHQKNGGKGAAVKTGLIYALEKGFTHALQVDADGQHHLADVQVMCQLSQQHPLAVICGQPLYGDDVPKSRFYGRKITNFWNCVNTLSFDIVDGMCGFRLYPLVSTVDVIKQDKLGNRMDFDIEILVRMHWRKIPMLWVKTPVKYELGGVSHFRGLSDNWLISKMHARLFFAMLGRLVTRKGV